MNNTNHNIFDEERRNNFYELYISNVDKRLRELDQPKDVDCKRWVWELIQNAKDSIVGQTDKKNVDIEIIAEGDKYTFKHNGSPFIKKTLYGLLYKYSKGKKDNSEITGRFGTGFLTTHTLSKIVNISGDIVLEDKIKGFSITMYREGEGEELLEGLNKTEDSFQLYDQSFGWTTFEYLAKTERNKEAGRLGIQNFKENITKVMLFCPEINSIKLNDNGKILTIKQGNKINNLQNGCEKLTLNVCDDNHNFSRTFLYENYEETNEQMNERFKQNRNLKICCAIELDNDNNIFVDESSPCLFCSLPFVGSEKHKLPFIINSQNFEPDSERQSILLDGKEINEKTGKISDQGINKMILIKSQKMYENLLQCLCNENIGKRYYLARGLTFIPENDEIQSFDHHWYKEKFVSPMRDILMKYSIVWNGEGYIKLENLPTIKCYTDSHVHQQAMDRICNKNVSEKEMNEKIAKLMEDSNNNPLKRFDSNFNNVANNLIEYNFEKIRNNSLNDEIMYIFGKVYLANIRNRLRELEHPSMVDCKRWIWELIQNAKDSIVGQKDRKDIDIEIIAEGDKYTFKHNGSPFTGKTLSALLYKFSESKSNNAESVGRFGTGFLTTHSLSKLVNISGNILSGNKINRFTVTMYREGEEEELLEGLTKTKNRYREVEDQSEEWTIFEYVAKTEKNKEAGRLGIQNFKENITKVMLFCPEIRSVKLIDNGKIITIKQGKVLKNLQGGCEKLTLDVNDDNNSFSRTFIYIKKEEGNKELSERFQMERNLRTTCAIEVDNDNNIFIDESSPSLFCSLPLVGSEKHKLPFIINSQDFEPDSERQFILLEGQEINERTGKISNQGINKMILLTTQNLFENLIECLCNENIGKRYLLARGLTSIPRNDEIQSFDHLWYTNKFIPPMRDTLFKYPIVYNGENYINLENIPILKRYKDFNIQHEAYEFMAKIYDSQVPTYEESIQFENYIWKDDCRIKYITMEECTKDISHLNNMTTLSEKVDNAWEWIDDFLVFIKKNESQCLTIYSIIPNMNAEFVGLTDDLSTSKEVPDNMIECLEKIGQPWKKTHIHKNLKKYTSGIDHNIPYAISVIKNYFNQWTDKILILISYIPNDNEDKKYVEKRNTIYDICKIVFGNSMPNKMDGNSFPKVLFNGIDEMVFEKIIENIVNQGKLGDIYTIEFMKMFLECVSEYYPTFRNRPVVPNQNGIFCLADNLFEDNKIPDLFKECVKNHFNYDIRGELIDKQLTYIKPLLNGRNKKICDYIDILNAKYTSKNISEENKHKMSREMIRIIPKKEEEEIKDNEFQRNVFDIYKIFTKNENECCEIQNDYQNKGLWYHPNKYIYAEIVTIIEKYNDINELCKALNIPSSQNIYDYLNIILKISIEGKIIPNQYEQFCYLKYLYNEGIPNIETNEIELISEELKDIAKDLGYDVRKYLIHPKINRICNSNVSEKEMNEKIAKLMEENNNNPVKRNDSNFNDVANSLIEYNFLKLRNNSLNDEIMYIFGKVYIANIRNRLRELENPSVIDSKRWVWELIQNAKDSIVGQKNKKSIDVEIIVEGNNYTFKHNGSPFTNKTLPALLYKFSEGKANSLESIGRFGTGFLTTHSVSKIIKISGDIISKNELKRFSVTMYREGEEEELLQGLNKTKNSYNEVPTDTEGWTIFEYEARTEKNKNAGRLGIQNFKENITKVMLFCPEIHSVKLNDNGKILSITQKEINDNLQGGCAKLTLDVMDDNKVFSRKFLYIKKENNSKELSERFKVDRNLRISCAIEIDNDNNIFVDESSPSLFCSLPVVGSEKHKLPCIINSQDFELNTERQAILLDGSEINEKTGKISDQGINKMILLKSQEMYETLLECLCKEKIGKRYLLARGLNSIPDEDTIQSFDSAWYKDNFVIPMRNILIKYTIVWNGEKFIELKNLPTITYYPDPNVQKEAYDFIAKVYDNQVPTFEESIQFENYIWKNDTRIKYITMEKCTQEFSNLKNMATLSTKFDNIEEAWKWIDDFLVFIKKNEFQCFKYYKIIPNMHSEFVMLTDTLSTSKEVPDNMIECLENIGKLWKSSHIHKKIIKYTPGIDHNIQYAISVIKGCFNNWSNKILTVISYIPNDSEDKKFVEKRNKIYDLCKSVFGSSMPNKMDAQKSLGGIYSIEFIKKFLECVIEYYPTFRKYPIVPNQNGTFCVVDNLYEDVKIPDLFKECIYIDIIKRGFHPPPPPSPPSQNNNGFGNSGFGNKGFGNNGFGNNGFGNKGFGNNGFGNNGFGNKGFGNNGFGNKGFGNNGFGNNGFGNGGFGNNNIFGYKNTTDNFVIDKLKTHCEIERNSNNYELWEDANICIFEEIIRIIEQHTNTDDLANFLGVDNKEKVFEHLNLITKYYSQGRIIPNQYKIFCYLDNLYTEKLTKEEKISDELKDIAKDFGYDARAQLIHLRMNKAYTMTNVLTKNIICNKIDNLMKEGYNNSKKHSDPTFKLVVNNLVETYFDKIGSEEFKKYFKFTFFERENIILKIIYNTETRKNMAELGKKYGEQCIPKLLQNEDIVNMIMDGKLNDYSNLKLLIEQFDDYEEIIGLILKNPDILNKIGDGDKKYHPKEIIPKYSKYSEIEKKYGEECIPKLLKNEDNSNLKSLIDKYEEYDDIIETLLKNPELTNMIEKGEITDESYKCENDLVAKLSMYSKVDDKYGDQCVPKLMENENIIKMIIEGKLSDNSKVRSLIDKYDGFNDIIGKLLDNPEVTGNIEKGEITDNNYKNKNELISKLSVYSEIDDKYGNKCVPKLLDNEGIVNMIIEGKINDKSKIKALVDKYDKFNDIIGKLLDNPEVTGNIEKGEITDDNYKSKNELISKLSVYSKIDEKYGNKCVPKLVDNESIVNMIIEGKLDDNSKVKSLLEQYSDGDDIINKLLDNPKMIEKIKIGEISDENFHKESYGKPVIINSDNNKSISVAFDSSTNLEEKEFYEKAISKVIKYSNDFDFTITNKFTGFRGEASIYEYLVKSNKFKSITWMRKKESGEKYEFNGKIYFLDSNDCDYDIVAETMDDRKFFIMVKSTIYDFDQKVPVYLNESQLKKMKKIRSPNEYILAVVYGVMNNPKFYFISLRSKIISKLNYDKDTYKVMIDLVNQYGKERISNILQNKTVMDRVVDGSFINNTKFIVQQHENIKNN
ncbi:hypothetical protein PIROE2DRAFT_7163 [Piromyces sp. E2]|nr:hypothetical protein PIROE2DRAFT_7163 [Piromyces sp. E2]|eukprot:OUM65748.1 hypothetical protein PIROE2DRAFT_7163 [Piromyces sp. E2]